MVLPLGVEPSSPALQTGALTTRAKEAWRATRESNPAQSDLESNLLTQSVTQKRQGVMESNHLMLVGTS